MLRHARCTLFLYTILKLWHITRLSINKHRSVIKAQISTLNPCVTVKFGKISGVTNIISMQIKQKNFKCFTMQTCRLFFTTFWNFWRITRFSTTNRRWVINA